MEASLRKLSYPCYQMVFTQNYSLSEGQESVVPDTLPDIAAILYTSAAPLIRSKDVSDGRVRLEVNVPARVSCEGEDGTVFCLDVNIPFYLSAQEEAIGVESKCVVNLTLCQIEARMLNPRKISVRADLDVRLECYLPGMLDSSAAPEDDAAALHVLERSADVSCVSCVTEKTFVLTDEAELPDALPAAAEIMAQCAAVSVQDVKAVGSKVIASGTVRSEILYRCDEGMLHSFSFSTTFSQIIETDCEAENALVELRVLLSGMYYEIIPGADMRELAMELHLVAQVVLRSTQRITYLADAYSNAFALDVQRESRCLPDCCGMRLLRESGRALMETPTEPERVISLRAEPISAEVEGGAVEARLRLVLCYEGEGGCCTVQRVAAQRLESALEPGQSLRICGVSVPEASAIATEGGAEARFTVEVQVLISQEQTLDAICAISYDETQRNDTDALPTLVMLRADQSRDLWELAKANCSTVEAICAANALPEPGTAWEKLLIIPKAP